MIRKQLLAVIASLVVMSSMATDFSDKQKAIIYNKAINVLKSYEELNNNMADAVVDMDEVNKTSQQLIDLFVNRKAIVYNDLDPNHLLSEAYELETYVTNMLLWYPDGMSIQIDFDNIKAGNIIDHGNDIYTVDLMAIKTNNGNYLNRQKNELSGELLYRIAFFKKTNDFENFKIAGVRSKKSKSQGDNNILADVKSVQFSDKEMELITQQSKSLMNDYINFINLLVDPEELDEDKEYYKISFIELFTDTTITVANDIEPEPINRWITVTNYYENLMSSYPEGIKNLGLNIDSTEYSKVISEGSNKYYINGYINKFFSGKYQNKTVFRDNDKYNFKISFEKDENTFKNFKLASIDKFGVNLYEETDKNSNNELPQIAITPLQRKGLYFGASVSGGLTHFSDPNLTEDPILKWEIQNNFSLSFDINTTYYFSNQFGLNLGLGYSSFEANTSLNGEFQNTESSIIEVNNESYYKQVSANFDSLLTFSYLTIPLSIIYHTNKKPEQWGLYAQMGVKVSFLLSGDYHSTGDVETTGYFYDFVGDNKIREDIPSWGFVNSDGIDNSGETIVETINISAIISLGVNIPLSYFTCIYLGPELVWGLTPLSKDSNYNNILDDKSVAKKATLSNYGLKFGISHKF